MFQQLWVPVLLQPWRQLLPLGWLQTDQQRPEPLQLLHLRLWPLRQVGQVDGRQVAGENDPLPAAPPETGQPAQELLVGLTSSASSVFVVRENPFHDYTGQQSTRMENPFAAGEEAEDKK